MTREGDFNLVDESWICVKDSAGDVREVSLRKIFHEAHTLVALSNELPTQDFAILRVLLAVLQRAVVQNLSGDEDPAEVWGDLWNSERLPLQQIDSYLDAWHDRFYLFDDVAPFMQVAGMHTSKNETSDVSKIVIDVPDGYQFFTMRSGREIKSLSYIEAARWLIHVHAFDTAGIKSGVVGDDAVKGGKSYSTGYPGWAGCLGGVYLEGSNLKETLTLNLVLWEDDANTDYLSSTEDIPVWEQDPKTPGDDGRTPKGYADIETWQSRRVRLIPSDGCVTQVVLTNGDKLEPSNKMTVESMSPWRRSESQEKKLGQSIVFMPMAHKSDRAFWRSLSSVLPLTDDDNSKRSPGVVNWLFHLSARRILPRHFQVALHAVGVEYGTQNSVVSEMVNDSLMANSFLLSQEGRTANALIRDVLERTDSAVYALGTFAKNMRLAAGDDDRDNNVRLQIQKAAFHDLDVLFRTWLTNITSNLDLNCARIEWNNLGRKVLLQQADDLVRQVEAQAITGHETRSGWMTASKAEAIFMNKLFELLPTDDSEKEGN